ncbi:MAG: NAD(P)H-dependent oxidoreductase [Gammaproteobacteria bacterium]|nr:NAD(P)H-dependent oxidoreductase [Gammaproteobacteria bacterium]
MSKRVLLIVYHSKSGSTERMARAVIQGAQDEELEGVAVVAKSAYQADASDLLQANAIILGTPENFGYMSGALKDFFDRTFYEVEGKIAPLPYTVFIKAGNDGTGALNAIRRIANGYPFVEAQEPLIVKGELTPADTEKCRVLGQTFAAALDLGIY